MKSCPPECAWPGKEMRNALTPTEMWVTQDEHQHTEIKIQLCFCFNLPWGKWALVLLMLHSSEWVYVGWPPGPEPQPGKATALHRSVLVSAPSADGTPPSPLLHRLATDAVPTGRYGRPAWHPAGFAPLPEKDHQSNSDNSLKLRKTPWYSGCWII